MTELRGTCDFNPQARRLDFFRLRGFCMGRNDHCSIFVRKCFLVSFLFTEIQVFGLTVLREKWTEQPLLHQSSLAALSLISPWRTELALRHRWRSLASIRTS